MDRMNIAQLIRKYRYVLLVLVIGMGLMLLPAPQEKTEQSASVPVSAPDLETRLERILSRIAGAGEVAVMLTEANGEEVLYQTDGEHMDTVIITDAQRSQQGLVRTRHPPTYRGAIIVCSGADSAAVRLAVVEAVSSVTGLGSDRITVLKME